MVENYQDQNFMFPGPSGNKDEQITGTCIQTSSEGGKQDVFAR